MTDYSTLIDAETWAFIEKTAESYPDDAVSLSIEGQRDVYDAMCKTFHAGYPEGVSAVDDRIAAKGRDIPVRRYVTGLYGHTQRPALMELLRRAPAMAAETSSMLRMLVALVKAGRSP